MPTQFPSTPPLQLATAGIVPPLDAAALGPLAQRAVDDMLHEGEADNTRRSYRAALRYWAAWYALRYREPLMLPVTPMVVMQFVVDHVERLTNQGLRWELPSPLDAALVAGTFKGKLGSLALNTVMHRIAVLSKVHTLEAQPNPCQDPAVRELLSHTRRGHAKRGALPHRKAALTLEPLQALLDTCDASLPGLRDRALLLFAWASGGRRRAEVTAATRENVRQVSDRLWIYTLGHAKTNQSGFDRPENDKPITGKAADALAAWLAASHIQSGALFRRIRKGTCIGEPLTPAAVRRVVRQRCVLAGLNGDFSAHSLRSGFVTEAGRQNAPLGDTMAMTGHTSAATVLRYYRAGGISGSRAAHLLDDEPPTR